MSTQMIIAIISSLCIKTAYDKDKKIDCINYYTNCVINNNYDVSKCKKEAL